MRTINKLVLILTDSETLINNWTIFSGWQPASWIPPIEEMINNLYGIYTNI